jgi:hypothetical protein
MEKRRFIGPNGAVFVPRVDESTIAQKVEAGEWRELPSASAPAPRRRKKVSDGS